MTRVAVIGAGSWGTAVSWLLGGKGLEVLLWSHEVEVAESINVTRHNLHYLKEVTLPETVRATPDPEEAVRGAEAVVMVTPSWAMRSTAHLIAPALNADTPVVSLAKGLDPDTLERMTEVLLAVLGGRQRLAALSGPNHAEEVSRGIPTATVVAAYDESVGLRLRELFMAPSFRVYTNDDVTGVELCAATKNVVAVAAGMSDGLGFGDNSKAALMTRGLAEMARLGRKLGANQLTYSGLAGMGDLIATCISRHSRNRGLGELVATGGTVEEYYERTHMVAEGATSSVTVDELGRREGVEMPITRQVRAILHEGMPASSAVETLMSRDATDEFHGVGLLGDSEDRR